MKELTNTHEEKLFAYKMLQEIREKNRYLNIGSILLNDTSSIFFWSAPTTKNVLDALLMFTPHKITVRDMGVGLFIKHIGRTSSVSTDLY